MSVSLISEYVLGDTLVRYVEDKFSGAIELQLLPNALCEKVAVRRSSLKTNSWISDLPSFMSDRPANKNNSLVQVHCQGDAYNPNDIGSSLLNSTSTEGLKYVDHRQTTINGGCHFATRFELPEKNLSLVHILLWREDREYVESSVEIENQGAEPQTIDLLSSFAIGGLSPFGSTDSSGRLCFHRYKSYWSREARLISDSAEDLHTTLPWINASFTSERFGHVGSWPSCGWFPFFAVEDRKEGVFWGGQLAHPGSWQMEFYRRDDNFLIAGGLADRNFGHWSKQLKPGEKFVTPRACMAVCHGTLDDLCARLQQSQADRVHVVEEEKTLPIQVNDFCIHWGNTSHSKIAELVKRIKGSLVRYLVIDAGWYKPENNDWNNAQGDWIPSKEAFPRGIGETSRLIREAGLVPGIWFEFEVVCPDAQAYGEIQHMLKLDGHPITVGGRRFWDFRDPWVIDYLCERVIEFLQENNFGYLKIDYNASLGIGVDGPDAVGENLRQHLEGVQGFVQKIRTAIPDLVIENCASGGMRLEPSMMAIASLGSFSDCHRTIEAPIIAANLHRLILPRQSLVWSFLDRIADERGLVYSLAAGFLGRICISGHLMDLSNEQWNVVSQALELYGAVSHIIANGKSYLIGDQPSNYRHPVGWQAVVRYSEDRREALVVLHCFEEPYPQEVTVSLEGAGGSGEFKIVEVLNPTGSTVSENGTDLIHWKPNYDYSSAVIFLKKNPVI